MLRLRRNTQVMREKLFKKKLQKIKNKMIMTSSRFLVKEALTTKVNVKSYFDTTTIMNWNVIKSSSMKINLQKNKKIKLKKLLNKLNNNNNILDMLTKKTINSSRFTRFKSSTKKDKNIESIKDKKEETKKENDYVINNTNKTSLKFTSENIKEIKFNNLLW